MEYDMALNLSIWELNLNDVHNACHNLHQTTAQWNLNKTDTIREQPFGR